MIDINKYFVEIVDNGGGTIGYTVVSPGKLLTEIIKQNKKLQALKEWKEANKPTGICETCTEKTLLQNDRYRNQIILLRKIIPDDLLMCCDKYKDCDLYKIFSDILTIIKEMEKA